MARNPQTQGSQFGAASAAPNAQATAQASSLSDDDEMDEPVKPELSAADQIAALQAQIAALQPAVVAQPEEAYPGSTIRPTRGPLHPSGVPIFNAGRPTGRAG